MTVVTIHRERVVGGPVIEYFRLRTGPHSPGVYWRPEGEPRGRAGPFPTLVAARADAERAYADADFRLAVIADPAATTPRLTITARPGTINSGSDRGADVVPGGPFELWRDSPVEVNPQPGGAPAAWEGRRVHDVSRLVGVYPTVRLVTLAAPADAADSGGDGDFRVRRVADGRVVASVQVRDGAATLTPVPPPAGGGGGEFPSEPCALCGRRCVPILCARCGRSRCGACMAGRACCGAGPALAAEPLDDVLRGLPLDDLFGGGADRGKT